MPPLFDTTHQAPLAQWEDGSIRIGHSRVTLDSLVHEFNRGSTAEQIQDDFPTLTLREVYGAIAYYLENQKAVDDYLRKREREAEDLQRSIEAHQDTDSVRRRIRERYATLKPSR